MNLCSNCLKLVGLKVTQPQLLKIIEWCDGCNAKKKAFDTTQIMLQHVAGDSK